MFITTLSLLKFLDSVILPTEEGITTSLKISSNCLMFRLFSTIAYKGWLTINEKVKHIAVIKDNILLR
jgi:hypothetical protein